MAGLMRKQFKEWIQPALPWTFFGIMILGTGILMGAAWAYEALSLEDSGPGIRLKTRLLFRG